MSTSSLEVSEGQQALSAPCPPLYTRLEPNLHSCPCSFICPQAIRDVPLPPPYSGQLTAQFSGHQPVPAAPPRPPRNPGALPALDTRPSCEPTEGDVGVATHGATAPAPPAPPPPAAQLPPGAASFTLQPKISNDRTESSNFANLLNSRHTQAFKQARGYVSVKQRQQIKSGADAFNRGKRQKVPKSSMKPIGTRWQQTQVTPWA